MRHTAAGDAGRVAKDGGVDELVLIHVHPQLSAEDELVEFAQPEFPNTRIGEDLLSLRACRALDDATSILS
jgi:ribonuclease BN (tRNA processing enzyme)